MFLHIGDVKLSKALFWSEKEVRCEGKSVPMCKSVCSSTRKYSRFVVLVCIFNEVSQNLNFSRDFKSDVTVRTKDGPQSAPYSDILPSLRTYKR